MNVGETFLHYPKNGQLDLPRQAPKVRRRVELRPDAAALRVSFRKWRRAETSPKSSSNGGCRRYAAVRTSREHCRAKSTLSAKACPPFSQAVPRIARPRPGSSVARPVPVRRNRAARARCAAAPHPAIASACRRAAAVPAPALSIGDVLRDKPKLIGLRRVPQDGKCATAQPANGLIGPDDSKFRVAVFVREDLQEECGDRSSAVSGIDESRQFGWL